MADVTWTKTTSGTVQDTQGNNVGTADGAGTITITANVEVGPATDTLTITEGVTVKFDTGVDINVRCTAASGTYGSFICIGTVSEPVVLTSNAGTPAAGDWAGIDWIGANASFPAVAPIVDLTHTVVEYYTGITSQVGAGIVPNSFSAMMCTFRHFDSAALSNQAGLGGTFPWDIQYCQFIQCVADWDSGSSILQCVSGGLPGTSDDRAHMDVDHCSFLIYYDDNFTDLFVFNIGNRSEGTLTNCCVVAYNSGTGEGNIAQVAATQASLTNNNNFYLSPDAGASEDFTPDATDQNVDPAYLDDTCTAADYDLSPDALVGSPLLYVAASDGVYVGAVEPYNYPSGGEPDPEGTTGVWAGRRQRVYEYDFGDDSETTRGRAIRVGVTSTDLLGQKILAGLYIKAHPERLK